MFESGNKGPKTTSLNDQSKRGPRSNSSIIKAVSLISKFNHKHFNYSLILKLVQKLIYSIGLQLEAASEAAVLGKALGTEKKLAAHLLGKTCVFKFTKIVWLVKNSV